uniref:Uncharacterized protein n=1 Tax=Anguilla anguilla TaxID=7936 RepID=A0A0E9X5U1_ANGAN
MPIIVTNACLQDAISCLIIATLSSSLVKSGRERTSGEFKKPSTCQNLIVVSPEMSSVVTTQLACSDYLLVTQSGGESVKGICMRTQE